MHANIAALSSGVPTSAISYSPKTLGVFETCGQGEHVADPQKFEESDIVDLLWQSWLSRENAIEKYNKMLPYIQERAENQMRDIIDTTTSNL